MTPEIRKVVIDGHGEFDVPRHVSRVDSWKVGTGGRRLPGWHGWQVRWPEHSKFFTDAAYGGIEQSLEAASAYVEKKYPGKRSQCRPKAGVRLIERKQKKRNTVHIYVEVAHPERGVAAKRLYVGTSNTINASRIAQRMREGQKLRKQFIAQHKKKTGTI